MNEARKIDPKKALKHESKGDKLKKKEKFREALKEYQKSESLNPDRPEIYEKLIETHGRVEREWAEQDFSDSLTWTMRRQELQHPQIRWVHETFSAEYQEVKMLIQELIAAADPETEVKLMQKIRERGEKALLPLLHFALSVKAVGREAAAAADETNAAPPDSL